MKLMAAFLILASMAFGQAQGKIVTFNRADTAHCKVVAARGKPLLQSTYEGTTVAIALPLNRGNGDFSIFAVVSRAGDGNIEVDPRNFYGVFSDKDHTRFQFFDLAAAMDAARAPGTNTVISAANSKYDPSTVRYSTPRGGSPVPVNGQADDATPPSGNRDMSAAFFRKGKIKPGSSIAGWITLRPPKRSKLEVHSTDMLDEIDIPVNGVLFRF